MLQHDTNMNIYNKYNSNDSHNQILMLRYINFIDIKHKIQKNPNYYDGKSVEDLIEMQQDNINDLLQPAKVFPISLFSFLFTGMIFTILIGFLKSLFKNLY